MKDYKRLTTKKDGYCKSDCFGQGICLPQSNKTCHIRKFYNRLAELEDKIEDGQLLELNTKPLTLEELKALKKGDWVWMVDNEIPQYSGYYQIDLFAISHLHLRQGLGKTVIPFLTYGDQWEAYKNEEEAKAEARLKELREKK